MSQIRPEEKCYLFSNQCENSLMVSHSAHTSSDTVNLKHSAFGTRIKYVFDQRRAEFEPESTLTSFHVPGSDLQPVVEKDSIHK